ncbi:kynureninase [Ornithinibacillus halotolerans]|uniref:Kynureninase n=1 Tax=Ornithinibacillus halotolerans TaxID=1274357 RepID=A0A916WCM3_9BACI|nr:kynureninase [Ornithinibacillus halotolerans]GGA88905.1 kynureninase [Ornithinibacillus halotolerans]
MIVNKEYALSLDKEDPISHFREEFYVSDEIIYLDGNSLGLLSKRSEKAVLTLLDSWKKYAIDGWTEGNNPWFYLSEEMGKQFASLVGATDKELIATGSTTTNLHQLLATFYKPKGNKTKILADELNFPSDIYAIKSHLQLHGLSPEDHLVTVKSRDGHTLRTEDIISQMTDEIALIILPSVLYRSGQILDMSAITTAAHERDIVIGFDLCHSIGSVPHDLSNWKVDFAFWCTYKHLNGGPGSVGGIYVNEKHLGKEPGLSGWFSSAKDKQFDLEYELTPALTAGAYQIGTPHILSLAPLIGSLEIFNEARIETIRKKSLQLTDYLIRLIEAELTEYTFEITTPKEAHARGGHIYLTHQNAASICKALKSNGVIPDFRNPNGIRLAPVALYNTFEEVWKTVQILKRIMEEEQYKKYDNTRGVIA